ncbi:MAG: imidazole glycerol phosphate synthase subunit HisH [Acidobacteriota bacterium]|nr:imidazole glycerol phosphate synthase subunit HisH [Acidobacteriota bacterium]
MGEPGTLEQGRGERPRIAVVDYGMGNRRSAEKALQRAGADAFVSFDHDLLAAADGLLLPGVGAFPAAMETIGERGLGAVLRERAGAGVPVFGACLGMQILFERSEEHGGAEGLGLLGGEVRALRAPGLSLPHIGWSAVRWVRDASGAERPAGGEGPGWPLSAGLPNPTYLYHVHSFIAAPGEEETVLGVAEYGEVFPAVVGAGNVFGSQSHPEKSSTHGLRLLANFVALCGARAAGAREGAAGAATQATPPPGVALA